MAALARGVLEHEVLAGGAGDGALHHLDEPAHTVLLVHDEVAGAQLEGVDLVAAPRRHPPHVLGRGARAAGRAGEVGLGDDGEAGLGRQEAGADGARGDGDETAHRVGLDGDQAARGVVLGEHLGDALGQAGALGGDQHLPVVGHQAAQLGDGLVGVAAEGGGDLEAEVEGVALVVTGERREVEPAHPELAGLLAQLGEGAEGCRAEHRGEVDGHGVAAGGVGPAGVEELLAGGGEVVGAGAHPLGVARHQHGAVGQQVEQGLHAVDQGRGERLHALDGDALGELLEQVGRARQLVGEGRRPLAHGIGEQQLAARRRPQPVLSHLERALVGDLEPADLLDGVAPELQAQRVLLGGREDVEDAAAHGELAAALDEVGAGVGGRRQGLDDLLERHVVAGLERDRLQVTEPLGDGLEHRAHRRDDHRQGAVGVVAGLGVCEPAQHRQALADGVAAGAQPLVREGLPRGEQRDGPRAQARLERGVEVFGLSTGGGDGEDRGARAGGRQGGDEDGAGPGGCRRDDLRRRHREGLDEAGGAREGGDPGAQGGQRRHSSQPSGEGRQRRHRWTGPTRPRRGPSPPTRARAGSAAQPDQPGPIRAPSAPAPPPLAAPRAVLAVGGLLVRGGSGCGA